jgi:sulfopyruvate decarboxylase beta subunit
MRRPEKELISILKEQGVDFTCSLPCEKIKHLLKMVAGTFFHVPLTREEEGVGICAGASLSGKRPALFVQSSGVGNMINALLSLTGFYKLPLAVFVSQRGVFKEKIEAQVPMGSRLPMILRGAGIPHTVIDTKNKFVDVRKRLAEVYRRNEIHAFLLSPRVWEGTSLTEDTGYRKLQARGVVSFQPEAFGSSLSPRYRRFDILKIIAPFLDSKVVVCNLGLPSKELFHVKHQPSNFYMLGSMGMATPVGLGIALTSSDKQVVVIDGDGSLLMNPGTLATTAHFAPENLTIIAIDNGSYGSTGDQPTLTRSCVDLELVARGFGIKNTFKVSSRKEIVELMRHPLKGLRFIHALCLPGNEDVPNIPLHHLEIKRQVQDFLKAGRGRSEIPAP